MKQGVETVGSQLTRVEMRLGAAKLSPLSGDGQRSDLFIGNPEGYKTPSAVKNAGQDILGKATTEQINKASTGIKELLKMQPARPGPLTRMADLHPV